MVEIFNLHLFFIVAHSLENLHLEFSGMLELLRISVTFRDRIIALYTVRWTLLGSGVESYDLVLKCPLIVSSVELLKVIRKWGKVLLNELIH